MTWLNETLNWMEKLNPEVVEFNNLITESQESKSISQAKKLVMQKLNYSEEQADNFVRNELRQDIPSLRTKNGGKFILGATRMFLDRQLTDGGTIQKLNKTIELVSNETHINEYDRNLNGLSAQELIDKFSTSVKEIGDKDREEIGKETYTQNDNYTIVPINDFNEASQYASYTSWCVTHDEEMLDSYTSDGIGQFYFCLRNDFKEVPKKVGENCPLDDYGLSMVAVSVDSDGQLNTCTCRWNHDNGGNDHIMNTKQISNLVGMNFYEVFKPNNKWHEMLSNAMERLKNGEDPIKIFDRVWDFSDGFAAVNLSTKYNFIDENGDLLSPNQWFDDTWDFSNGFAMVILNYKYNFIDENGDLLSPNQWFDDARNFRNGFVRVELNGKWNLIDENGNLLSPNQWFDNVLNFSDGFARVELNGNWNLIDENGNLLSKNQWFDDAWDFSDGFARVELNNKFNFIDEKGNLLSTNQWFDFVGGFNNGYAQVELNGKLLRIDKYGNIS